MYLERVEELRFVASHPQTIEESMLRRVVRGMEVQPRLSPGAGTLALIDRKDNEIKALNDEIRQRERRL